MQIVRENMNPKEIKSGMKGILLRPPGVKTYFRVYKDDGTFIDYNIAHSDLEIGIMDNEGDAYIYETPQGMVIDHSPQTLGLNETEKDE
jgi:hypothetical protein